MQEFASTLQETTSRIHPLYKKTVLEIKMISRLLFPHILLIIVVILSSGFLYIAPHMERMFIHQKKIIPSLLYVNTQINNKGDIVSCAH